jgi:hypothetical protein
LGRAYEASAAAGGENRNLALKWMNQTGAIVTELQSLYESLDDSVMRNLDAADKRLQERGCNTNAMPAQAQSAQRH